MNFRSAILAIASLITTTCFAQPPDLERPEAKRILEFMEWKDVNVIAIRQGVNAKGEVAPIYATVLGSRRGQQEPAGLPDADIRQGHRLASSRNAGKGGPHLTKDGYRKTKIWTTWWNGTSSQSAPPTRPTAP